MAPSARKSDDKQAAAKIRAYFAALPPDTRKKMEELREVIRSAAPDVTEHFSYGIPGFLLNGKKLVWYAAWKEHLSMYPISDAMKSYLDKYETSKGTVRFPLSEPLPEGLIKRIVKDRVADVSKA